MTWYSAVVVTSVVGRIWLQHQIFSFSRSRSFNLAYHSHTAVAYSCCGQLAYECGGKLVSRGEPGPGLFAAPCRQFTTKSGVNDSPPPKNGCFSLVEFVKSTAVDAMALRLRLTRCVRRAIQ
jgi:hypothetical protein